MFGRLEEQEGFAAVKIRQINSAKTSLKEAASFLSTRLQILKGSQGAVHVEMNYMIIAAASAPSHIVKVLGQSFVSARSKDIYIDKNT